MAEVSVAIADDNRQTLNLLGEILEKEDGIHVVGKADNGEDAYNMIVETNPDIVLMDVIMPRLDGISVMERVRNNSQMKGTPSFIMVTAASSQDVTEDAFRLGANYYIMKPFSRDVVLDKIRRVSRGRVRAAAAGDHGGVRRVQPYLDKAAYMEQNLETDVTQMLHEIGIPAHIKGYQYLRDAIIMSVQDAEMTRHSKQLSRLLPVHCLRQQSQVHLMLSLMYLETLHLWMLLMQRIMYRSLQEKVQVSSSVLCMMIQSLMNVQSQLLLQAYIM